MHLLYVGRLVLFQPAHRDCDQESKLSLNEQCQSLIRALEYLLLGSDGDGALIAIQILRDVS
jgi:hypothetical protein